MAIIKFKITRLPKRAILKVDAVPMVLGQEYTIPQQAQMTCDVSDLGVPYDDFGYKLGNDKNIWSAEYKCTVNANVDTGAFIITNEVFDVTINNTTANTTARMTRSTITATVLLTIPQQQPVTLPALLLHIVLLLLHALYIQTKKLLFHFMLWLKYIVLSFHIYIAS